MPFSEADQRTVLLHLEIIRNIIRGVKPETAGDVVEVAEGYVKRSDSLAKKMDELCGPAAYHRINGQKPAAEPDLDGGLARQAAETASRDRSYKPGSGSYAITMSDEADDMRLHEDAVAGLHLRT